jgi:hypothetical protein
MLRSDALMPDITKVCRRRIQVRTCVFVFLILFFSPPHHCNTLGRLIVLAGRLIYNTGIMRLRWWCARHRTQSNVCGRGKRCDSHRSKHHSSDRHYRKRRVVQNKKKPCKNRLHITPLHHIPMNSMRSTSSSKGLSCLREKWSKSKLAIVILTLNQTAHIAFAKLRYSLTTTSL